MQCAPRGEPAHRKDPSRRSEGVSNQTAAGVSWSVLPRASAAGARSTSDVPAAPKAVLTQRPNSPKLKVVCSLRPETAPGSRLITIDSLREQAGSDSSSVPPWTAWTT